MTSYQQGRRDFDYEYEIDENPYDIGTTDYDQWVMGWQEAYEDETNEQHD